MKKLLALIGGCLLLGLILFSRLYNLGIQPPGLHIDEVSFAADAKAIAETGRDTWNTPWPTIFKAFGEWKAPGLTYSMAFWDKVLGRMDTTVTRLPSAVAGIFLLLMFALTLAALDSAAPLPVIIFATVILAFSPWHFDMSRIFYEAFSALAVFSVSLWLMTRATLSKEHHRWDWFSAAVFAGLAGYWYASIRYVVIAALGVAVIVQKWSPRTKIKLGFVLLLTLLVVGGAWVKDLVSDKGLNRLFYYQTKSAYGATLEIDDKRQYCFLSFARDVEKTKLCYAIWNKPIESITNAGKTYYTYLGSDFLFLHAISEYGFDNEYGAYLLPLLPLYLIGLFVVLQGVIRYLGAMLSKKEKVSPTDRVYAIYVATVVLSLLPAAVANNVNMRMGLIMLYLVGLTIGVGLIHAVAWCRTHLRAWSLLVYLGYTLIVLFFIVQSLMHYFLVFTHSNDLLWTSDAGAIFGYVKSVSPQYDHIVDTELHGPLAPYFYGDITTDEVQHGVHSAPDQFGFTYLTAAGKYELRHADIKDLACEKLSHGDTRKILVITIPHNEFVSIRKFAAYSWNQVYVLHEVYDLDDVVANLVRTNSSFKEACSPK